MNQLLVKKTISIPLGPVELSADLCVPEQAHGLIIFAHGSGSSRQSPRNQQVATYLNGQGMATILFDLLTNEEDVDFSNRFNIDLLAQRLEDVTKWIHQQEQFRGLRIGYFGDSTGGAAALMAARDMQLVSCIVSRGGRPDLAMKDLPFIRIPVLLIVGARDGEVVKYNEEALQKLPGEKKLEIIPGAGHLFEEEGAMEKVCVVASNWFRFHMQPLALFN